MEKMRSFFVRYHYILEIELLHGPSFPFYQHGLTLRYLMSLEDLFLIHLHSNDSALGRTFVEGPRMFDLFTFFLGKTFYLYSV